MPRSIELLNLVNHSTLVNHVVLHFHIVFYPQQTKVYFNLRKVKLKILVHFYALNATRYHISNNKTNKSKMFSLESVS